MACRYESYLMILGIIASLIFFGEIRADDDSV